jgi:regulator of RNase E activity RraB
VQFRSESAQKANLDKQLEMLPRTIQELRTWGVTSSDELQLECFFYTDTQAKATELEEALKHLGYSPKVEPSASDPVLLLVTGWTSKMKIEDSVVSSWVQRMCRLGTDHDAEFDGWGTNPNQK